MFAKLGYSKSEPAGDTFFRFVYLQHITDAYLLVVCTSEYSTLQQKIAQCAIALRPGQEHLLQDGALRATCQANNYADIALCAAFLSYMQVDMYITMYT